jgi:hypothetical protein
MVEVANPVIAKVSRKAAISRADQTFFRVFGHILSVVAMLGGSVPQTGQRTGGV